MDSPTVGLHKRMRQGHYGDAIGVWSGHQCRGVTSRYCVVSGMCLRY